MPRFYISSPSGDGDTLAYRLYTEDEDVTLRIQDAWCRPNLEGIVSHTQSPPRKGDIVIFGTSKAGDDARQLQRQGFAVIGGSPLCDKLEMDRAFFSRVCEELRIAIPPTERFTDYDAARKFLRKSRLPRYVFKPSGDQDAACTYVAKDIDDMLLMFTNLEKKLSNTDFLLQEFVDGVELSVEGWFDGKDWVAGAWNATMETKKLMAGDIGPATGCASSIVYVYDEEPAWATKLHRKFTALLKSGHYVGPFDLNTIQTQDQMYVLEATPRFGYDAIQNFVELWAEPFGVVMEQLAAGALTYLDTDTTQLSASVRLSIPPYPSADKDHRAPGDVPILIEESDRQHCWLSGVRQDDDQWFSAPTDGVIGALVQTGGSIDKTVYTLLETASRLNIPNLQYRNDVGAGHMVKWEQLDVFGFDLPPLVEALLTKKPSVLPRAPFAHQAWRAI